MCNKCGIREPPVLCPTCWTCVQIVKFKDEICMTFSDGANITDRVYKINDGFVWVA
jgi:hypothetical protein